jgi:hypothetical protein
MEKLTKETFQRWRSWAERIRDDLQSIVSDHQIYEQFIEIVNGNLEHIEEHHGRLFCDFVRKCYGVHAATGIRRHAKKHKDSISLVKLLDQLQKSASQFTYEFYLEQFPLEKDQWEWQKATFAGFTENGRTLSVRMILGDIEEIRIIAEKVSVFADRAIAHLDQRGIGKKVTYDDLADSIILFNKMACKYLVFITGTGYTTLRPTILFDWTRIFAVSLDIRNGNES